MTQARPILLGALLAATALPGFAADLTIGRSNEPSSIDPQFSRTGNNYMTSELMFGRLVDFSPNFEMSPGLATEWNAVDDTTWEITLREGVKFHDGSTLTADDVLFSLERTDEVPNSPAPFGDMVSMIASMEKVDDLTVRVTTDTPQPRLMEDIGRVFVVKKAAVEGKTSEDFQTGDAAIGTGPYRYEPMDAGREPHDHGLRRLLGRGARVQGRRHPLHRQRCGPRRGAPVGLRRRHRRRAADRRAPAGGGPEHRRRLRGIRTGDLSRPLATVRCARGRLRRVGRAPGRRTRCATRGSARRCR